MIVSLVSQKGGVGKSCLALAISWEFQARGFRVLLVDTDPQKSSRRQSEKSKNHNLVAPTTVSYGANIGEPNQLASLAEAFDHIVIDTPGRLSDVMMPVLTLSDVVLIPNGPCPEETDANTETVALVRGIQKTTNPELRCAFVFCRTTPKQTVLDKTIRRKLVATGVPVFHTDIAHRVTWREALTVGQGVAQHSPKEKAAAEVRALTDELLAFGGEQMSEAANG
jgi:chromosome partitioning protein